MRVVGGEFSGRNLVSPRTLRVRPTSDRVRENIFNILANRVDFYETKILDLFAGVGTVGIEALSRGAKEVVFVDDSHQSIQFLKRNTQFCQDRTTILPAKVDAALNTLAKKGHQFDVIFLDPPYEHDFVSKTLQKIDTLSLLKEESVVIVQHSKREPVAEEWQNLQIVDFRPYGDTLITFLTRKTL